MKLLKIAAAVLVAVHVWALASCTDQARDLPDVASGGGMSVAFSDLFSYDSVNDDTSSEPSSEYSSSDMNFSEAE